MAQAQKMQEYCELKVSNSKPSSTGYSHIDERSKSGLFIEPCVLMRNIVGFFALLFFRLSVGGKCYSNTLESPLMKMPASADQILVITVSKLLSKERRKDSYLKTSS